MPEDTIPVKSDGAIEASDWAHYIKLLAWVPLTIVIHTVADIPITFAIRLFGQERILGWVSYTLQILFHQVFSWLAVLIDITVLVVFLWIGVQCLRAYSK